MSFNRGAALYHDYARLIVGNQQYTFSNYICESVMKIVEMRYAYAYMEC